VLRNAAGWQNLRRDRKIEDIFCKWPRLGKCYSSTNRRECASKHSLSQTSFGTFYFSQIILRRMSQRKKATTKRLLERRLIYQHGAFACSQMAQKKRALARVSQAFGVGVGNVEMKLGHLLRNPTGPSIPERFAKGKIDGAGGGFDQVRIALDSASSSRDLFCRVGRLRLDPTLCFGGSTTSGGDHGQTEEAGKTTQARKTAERQLSQMRQTAQSSEVCGDQASQAQTPAGEESRPKGSGSGS
jgi:hypothetical protein